MGKNKKKDFIYSKKAEKLINISIVKTIIFIICLIVILIILGIQIGFSNLYFFIIIVIAVIIVIALFILLLYKQKRIFKELVIDNRNKFLTSFYSINSQMEIIIGLLMSLEEIKNSENNPKMNLQFKKLENIFYQIKENNYSFNKYEEYLTQPELIDEEELEEEVKKVNNLLFDIKSNIMETVSDFVEVFILNKKEVGLSNIGMATLVYYLANMIPIISDLSSQSNKFSRSIIVDVIQQFEEIANFSNQITEDIQKTMQELMDEQREDSLAFIIHKAHEVVKDFEDFFNCMQNLEKVSNNFVESSIDKLSRISNIAESIEEIAETIKVISLNVSIEAANTGSTAKGFQVLARDLREFAYKTMTFAKDVKEQVNDTIVTTEHLKEDYMKNMTIVFDYVKDIKSSIEAFEQIIVKSFDKIKRIIQTLRDFSDKISNGIKEIVGKLQYYDITSQEVDHLSQFIKQIFQMSRSQIYEIKIEDILENKKRASIKEDILRTVNNIITTANEREILEQYEDIFGIKVTEDKNDEIHGELSDIDVDKKDTIILF